MDFECNTHMHKGHFLTFSIGVQFTGGELYRNTKNRRPRLPRILQHGVTSVFLIQLTPVVFKCRTTCT